MTISTTTFHTTHAIRPPLATGRCATPNCSNPAQPGRDICSECIRAGILGLRQHESKEPPKTRRCLSCGVEIDGGGNGQRKRCAPCSRDMANRKKKEAKRIRAAKQTPETDAQTDALLAKMESPGMNGFQRRVRRAHVFPEGVSKG